MKQPNRVARRYNRTVLCCALASCLAVAAPAALAQSANAILRGQVSGASGATEITARNIATGAVRRTRSAADGSYTLVGLEPGTYSVEADSGPAQTVRLSVASTATLNLSAAGGAVPGTPSTLEAVVVTGSPVEVKTSEVGKTVSLHQIQQTPQITRNFLEFADAVPGMIFTSDKEGHTKLTGGGQNASSTNVYIDGVGQKSYVKEGGVAGQFASAGNPFPQLAIGEYKVITSNYKAEYGQISSAAVTAVTKSGTNDFHGEAFYRYTDDNMRARTASEDQPGQEKVSSSEKEYGFAVGGPIIQDRLHFFFTYEAKRFSLPTTVVADNGADGGVPSLPPEAAAFFGPATKPFQEDLYFGKLDWELTDADRLELSGQYRDEAQEDFTGSNSRQHGTVTDNHDKRFSLRWEHSADRWFNEVLATHEDSFNNPVPITDGNGFIYQWGATNDPTIIQIGGASPLAAQTKGQKGWSLEDNLTFNNFDWHGGHTVKMGARYKDIDLHAADALDINPQFYFTLDNPTFTSDVPYKAFFTKPVTGVGGLSPSVVTSAKQYGLYIQDDWAVNEHLLLNLGLRWDYEENPAYLDFVTPDNVVAALNAQDPNAPAGQTYAQSLANGGIDINDYIGTGSNRSAPKDEWQPRLGFSYDIGADENHVVHGGAGRSYDRDLYDYLQLEITKAALPQFTVYFQDPTTGACRGDPCFVWDPNYLNGLGTLQGLVQAGNGGEVDMLNNDLKVPYSDQFSLGMTNKVGDWVTDATVARILSYDGFVFTLGNRYPNGDFFENGSQPWGNGVPGFGALILGSNGIETKTTQLLLSAQKPYSKESGWAASIAYTYTNAIQNRDINEHYSFDRATIADYPFIRSNAAPRNRIVMIGSYDIPWGITLGAKITLATPTPGNTFACHFVAPTTPPTTELPCQPVGVAPSGNGRFIIGGQYWGYRSVDLQATKEFPIGDQVTAFGRLDAINIFDFHNYSDINYVTMPDGSLEATYNPTGNITSVPRMVKLEVGLRF